MKKDWRLMAAAGRALGGGMVGFVIGSIIAEANFNPNLHNARINYAPGLATRLAGEILGVAIGVALPWLVAAIRRTVAAVGRLQFSLSTLFIVTTVAACSLGIYRGLTLRLLAVLAFAAIPCAPTILIVTVCVINWARAPRAARRRIGQPP